ncbi:MAG TPA: tetratricopeptide repeat protein [Longimicrobiales bacterium]|nr:tetratricopeptide repeat protein [Longimicrobiales bacterium]
MTDRRSPGIVRALARSRLPQVLGGYLAVGFGVLQVVDMFVDRLGLPDWAFFGMLVLLIVGVPVIVATAIAQHRAREQADGGAPATVRTHNDAAVGGPVSGAEGTVATAAAGGGEAAAKPAVPSGPRWLTWRNAFAGGVASFAALAVVVAVFMAMRSMGIRPAGSLVPAGVLDRSERILIADFQSQTGDTLLAGAVTEAFRIDFEQSRIVQVVDAGAVRAALLRMQRPPDSPLDPGLAGELAEREGIKAVMTGEINTAGRTFVVSARLLSADGSNVLVSLRETARDSAAIIAAIDRLSNRMRERIGESLRTIRAGEPLAQVTTSSLAALRKYSQAVRALDIERDPEKGIPLLEEAIALDTLFAMAYRKLGVAMTNQNEPRERWLPVYTRAFELSDRLPDRERYMSQAAYHKYVRNDNDRAIATYRTLLDLYPNETPALNNLALLHAERGDSEEAATLYARALAIDSTTSLYYTNLIHQLGMLGHTEEARDLLERYTRRFPDHSQVTQLRASFAYLDGHLDSAAAHYRGLAESSRGGGMLRVSGESGLAALALLHGRLEDAVRHYDRAFAVPIMASQPDAKLRREGTRIQVRFGPAADTVGALRLMETALAGTPLDRLDPSGGALLEIAMLYAFAGREARAREFLTTYDRMPLDEGLRRMQADGRRMAGIWLTLLGGDAQRAIADMRTAVERQPCRPCAHLQLGRAHDLATNPDSAIHHYARFVESPMLNRHELDGFNLPRVHERLGQLYDARGDRERAAFHLARFTELWQDADPELQPAVDAARRRLGVLVARPG